MELELFGEGPVELTNGSASIVVDRVAIRLYGGALGTISVDHGGVRAYELPSGAAHFLVSGIGAGPAYGLRWASNSSPIKIHDHPHGWVADGFSIEHVDHEGESWTIVVPETTWD